MMTIQALTDLAVVLVSCAVSYSFGIAIGRVGRLSGGAEMATLAGPDAMQSTYVTLAVLTSVVCLVSFRTCGLYPSRKSLLNVE